LPETMERLTMTAAQAEKHYEFLCKEAAKYKHKYGNLIPYAIFERIKEEATGLTDRDISYIVWRITGVYQNMV